MPGDVCLGRPPGSFNREGGSESTYSRQRKFDRIRCTRPHGRASGYRREELFIERADLQFGESRPQDRSADYRGNDWKAADTIDRGPSSIAINAGYPQTFKTTNEVERTKF